MQQDVDADFARYVRARQHGLLRAAYLVCGDARLAEQVLEQALASVADRWERLREHPDTAVRQQVYGDAVSAAKRAQRDSLSADLGVVAARGGSAPDVHRALDALGARQRAAVVLRFFEQRPEADAADVLGESVPGLVRLTGSALATLGEVLPSVRATDGDGVSADALGDLLDHASQHVVEVDLADRAWLAAGERRRARRRRLVSAVAGVAALALVAVVAQAVVRRGDPPVPPGPTSTATAAVKRLTDGTVYASMPLEGAEDQLPDYDAGLPSVIDPRGRAVTLSSLPSPPTGVVAVYLRRAGTHYRAVLVPENRTQVVVDSLDLLPTQDSGGDEGVPLGPKAISDDGQAVVFAQPGAVVQLDLTTGTAQRYVVPAPDLQEVGWRAGRTVFARAGTRAWTLDLGREGASTSGGAPRAVAADVPVPLTSGLGLPVTDLEGETVSAGRWSASGAYFDQDVTAPVIVRGNGPIYQGLVAVDSQAQVGRVLLAPESPDGRTGRFKGCCTVLSWADASTVLFRSAGYDGSWVLAWNVETGRVYDVTRLDEGGGVDYPQALALAVGSRG